VGAEFSKIMRINDIYASIQGEGSLAGTPMVIVRLHGCGVGCPFCDTKETWEAKTGDYRNSLPEALGTNPKWTGILTPEIAQAARRTSEKARWALVTGGEPAEQEHLDWLVEDLHKREFKVALETSGTALGHVGAGFDWVCVSPKFDMPGGKAVLPDACEVADELKMVVSTEGDIKMVEVFLAALALKDGVVVSLQPVSGQKKATKLCVDACAVHGWRLSLQLHKYIDVR